MLEYKKCICLYYDLLGVYIYLYVINTHTHTIQIFIYHNVKTQLKCNIVPQLPYGHITKQIAICKIWWERWNILNNPDSIRLQLHGSLQKFACLPKILHRIICFLTYVFRHWSNKNKVLHSAHGNKKFSSYSENFQLHSTASSILPISLLVHLLLRDGFPTSFIPSRQYLHSKSQLKEHFLKSVVNIFHQFFLTNIQSNYPAPCLFHFTMHFEKRSLWRMLYSMLSSDQLVARLHSVCTLRKLQMRGLKSPFFVYLRFQ